LVAPRLHPVGPDVSLLATGESACAGVGTGLVVDDPDEAAQLAGSGLDVVLARPTTSPQDLAGMLAARAVITEEGGGTSHAAVVSRALGLPCVVGCGAGTLSAFLGHVVTVDGAGGRVYPGPLPVDVPREEDLADLRTLIAWARELAPLDVTATSEGIDDSEILDLGAYPGGNDPELVADVIRAHPGRAVLRGGAVAAPAAVAAAVETGVTRIVASPVLPVLLTALQSAGRTASGTEGPAR
jgi:pyruvate,orthophosphate dikinase